MVDKQFVETRRILTCIPNNQILSCLCVLESERVLHAGCPSMWTGSPGHYYAKQQSKGGIHQLPAAETSGRDSQHHKSRLITGSSQLLTDKTSK